ncbi:MAG: PD40 domain-containing protein [Anaerolineales bacterium]|nr:PD40 domain-containing protein [Anaerolineales bacterium]
MDGSNGRVKKTGWMIVIILAVAGLSAVAVVCGAAGLLFFTFSRGEVNVAAVTEAVTTLTDPPALNQIAFVGSDGNIWLVAPDGQNLRSVTGDGKGYRFPTWAPDGRHLAFIGPNENDEAVLFVTPSATAMPTILFDQPEAAPFYLYWSPDSQAITFLTQEPANMSMRQVAADAPGSGRILEKGAPFYWVWSPRGDKLLMHVGGSRAVSDEAHLSLLDNRAGAERVELDLAPGRFQAPFWSADGQYFYYIAADEQGQEAIYKTNAETLEQVRVAQLQSFAYMAVSPDNQRIAYIQIERNSQPPFGVAYLVGTDGSGQHQLLDNPVGSLYWSPDGRKLALLTLARRDDSSTAKAGGLAAPLSQEIVFRWLIYEVATDNFETLISFTPTEDFLQTVPFFDQYHLSLTFWSPDSRYFVVAKEAEGKNTIWVLDTAGEAEPLQVGEGTLAVWSWK